MSKLSQVIFNSPTRMAIPIGVYSGLDLIGCTVKDAVTNSQHQSDAVLALHEHFNTSMMLTAMDLSAEAEAFGCEIRMSDDEIPTVIGRRVTSLDEIVQLNVPKVGDARTAVHLDTARKLVSKSNGIPVLGGVIGPFSLAGRLFGVSEAMELSISDPDHLLRLLEKSTRFLIDYILAFRDLGASGVIMAEPAAGLLSPRGLSQFSSTYIKLIVDATETDHFSIILHNCGAKLVHLSKILESGAKIFHFGAPMDIVQALEQVTDDVILGGNLDPTGVFFSGTTELVAQKTSDLLHQTLGKKNFFISSGCDIPPNTPIRNLEIFYKTVAEAKPLV